MYFTLRAIPSAFRVLLRSVAGFWALAAMAGFSMYSIWVLIYNYDRKAEPTIASLLAISMCTLFSYYAWRISMKKNLDQRIRRSWRAFALAGICYGLGEVT